MEGSGTNVAPARSIRYGPVWDGSGTDPSPVIGEPPPGPFGPPMAPGKPSAHRMEDPEPPD